MSKSYWGLRNSAKKAISLAVSLSTALTMSGIAYFAIPAQVASAASCTAYTFSKNLQLGSRGTDVKNLQTSLNCLQNAGLPGTTYFGALTKAAVAAYQKAKGITPAVGYFGPKTRAAVNADLAGGVAPTTGATSSNAALIALIQQLLPAGSQRDAIIAALQATSVTTPATTATTATTTATTTAGHGPQLATPATGVAVSLAAVTPPAGTSIVAGGGQMSVLTLALTAGTDGPYTVTGITFTKTGVVSDSSINNLYLFRHYSNQFVAQYQSLSSGRATFAGMNLTIPAGSTYYLDLKVDLPGGSVLSAGNTVAFALNSASDINSVNAGGTLITETGNFPIQGNSMTVTTVSNPSLASVASATAYLAVGSSVYAGTTGFLAGSVNLVINSNSVKLSRIVWTETGSITASTDLKNLKLYVNGAQVGSTVSGLNSDGTVAFDLSASPVTLPTGANTVQVYVDVMGGPNRNFQMQVLHNYDVTLTDSVYNTTITFSTPSGTATTVSVQPATAVVSVDANTPTGNIAKGASGVVLAKFDVKASGENMKVLYVPFTVTFSGTAPANAAALVNYLKNAQLVDDQGNQVGTTISTPPSSNSTYSGGATYSDSFGSAGSNINYVIPANVTRVWSLKADIQSTFGGSGLTVALAGASNAVQGLVSNFTSSLGAASGSALTVVTTPFTVAQNTAFGSPTYVANQTAAKVGSFVLGASSAEGVNVSTLQFLTAANLFGATTTSTIQNLRVYVNGSAWPGSMTFPTITGGQTYSFSGSSPIAIPAGGSVIVDVYADVLSGAVGTTANVAQLSNATANGAVTNVAETFPGAASGQTVAIAGAGTLAVTAGTNIPANQLIQGAAGNVLGSWILTAGPNENVKITSLTLYDVVPSTSTVPATWQNLTLYSGGTYSAGSYSGGTQLVTGQTLTLVSTTSTPSYSVNFAFPTANPLTVPASQSVTVYVTGDLPAYSQATAASDGTNHTFSLISPTFVVAQGASSNSLITALVPQVASSTSQTVQRTKMYVASTAVIGSSTNRSRIANDDVGMLALGVNNAYGAQLNALTLTFSGSALNTTPTTTSAISLIDNDTGTTLAGATCPNLSFSSSTVSGATVACTLSPDFQVAAGASKNIRVRVNSSVFVGAISGGQTSGSLAIQIASAGNLVWHELNTSTPNFNLQQNAVPVTIASVNYI